MRDTINLNDMRSGNEVGIMPEPPRERYRGRGKLIVRSAIAIVVVLIGWWFVAGMTQWKAVFLTNNQVYFGHFLEVPFAGTITLRNVYYLQFLQPGQSLNAQDQSQLKLVQLGSEIHGPTDEMTIPVSQVLFWETLRSDSAIVSTIKNGKPTTP